MKQIVYNSFPRSGNVYHGAISRYFFGMTHAQVHMPDIFGIKEYYNVTVFRKPEDAIASLITKQSGNHYDKDKKILVSSAEKEYELYKRYMRCAKEHKDIIYIAVFDNFVNDTVKHFEDIAKNFDIDLLDNYRMNFLNAKFSGKIWDDRYDGHLPRPKNTIRLEIESDVKELSFIQELNQEYEEFILHYATVV